MNEIKKFKRRCSWDYKPVSCYWKFIAGVVTNIKENWAEGRVPSERKAHLIYKSERGRYKCYICYYDYNTGTIRIKKENEASSLFDVIGFFGADDLALDLYDASGLIDTDIVVKLLSSNVEEQ